MKKDIQYCFSVLFIFIGYSSIFHQSMKGNEIKSEWHQEKTQFFFSLAVIFLLIAYKIVMKQ